MTASSGTAVGLREALKWIPGLVPAYRGMKRLYSLAAGRSSIGPHKDALVSREYWERRAVEMWDYDLGNAEMDETYRRALTEALVELQSFDWKSLLEVGCGFGRVLRGLRMAFPDLVFAGVDFSFQQLLHGKKYLTGIRVGLMQVDARHLPFADKRFDVIFTAGTLIYLHPDELPQALQEFKRVGRRYIVLVEYAQEHMDSPLRQRLMREAPWYGHNYTDALRVAGIPIVKAYPMRAWADQPGRIPQSLIIGNLAV